jgi:hypothetical protein
MRHGTEPQDTQTAGRPRWPTGDQRRGPYSILKRYRRFAFQRARFAELA